MRTKTIRAMLMCALILVSLMRPTYAQTPGYTSDVSGSVEYSREDGTYTASYENTVSGTDYVLLVVAKSSDGLRVISESTVMYIDQQTAGENGVFFTFIPKATPDCEVLLAGDFGDTPSPIVLGELIAHGITVTGRVAVGTQPLVQLGSGKRENFTADFTAQVQGDGSFVFRGIPAGEYALMISQPYCLPYYRASLTLTEDMQLAGELTIYAGDIVPDGAINFADLSLLLRHYGASQNSGTPADINGDGMVNYEDLSALLSNYDLRAADLEE